MTKFTKANQSYKYTAIHLNIHSLPGKYDQLHTMLINLSDAGLKIDFIMLCETFLTNTNMNMFSIHGYNFVCNNRIRGRGGGVALYISDNFHFKVRSDLTVNFDVEFESIFVEMHIKNEKILIGEVYRVPGTNEQRSVQRYESLLQDMSDFNGDIMIGTDQNFNYINMEQHANTRDLFDLFIASGFIPTITIPTRITHQTSTLIDNIYVKTRKTENLTSGVISSDISDHLPIFNLIGTSQTTKLLPKYITCRKLNEDVVSNIINHLISIDWVHLLENLNVNEANDMFNKTLSYALDRFAPEKSITINPKNVIRHSWMTPALLKSSKTRDKLYRKSLGKAKDNMAYTNFIKYRNCFNRLKRIAKQTYYANQLSEYRNDLKKSGKFLTL